MTDQVDWQDEGVETRAEYKGLTVVIGTEEDGSHADPRQWDNLETFVCWHRSYDLGDRQPDGTERDALHRGGLRLLERYLRICHGAIAFVPLGLLDHSGLYFYADGGSHWSDSAGWDSGTVGFAFVTREDAARMGTPDLTPEDADKAIRDSIENYRAFLAGEVYYYGILDPEGNPLDGCGGFVGDLKHVKSEAIAQAEWHAEKIARDAEIERAERERAANHDIATIGG